MIAETRKELKRALHQFKSQGMDRSPHGRIWCLVMPRVLLHSASGELLALRRPIGFARELEVESTTESEEAVAGVMLDRPPSWYANEWEDDHRYGKKT